MSILRHKCPTKITTVEQALEILRKDSGGRTASWGTIDVARGVLERHSYHEGSSGGDSHDIDEIPIDKKVISELKMNGYVRGTPHWGYTDDNVLRISEHGDNAAWDLAKRKREADEQA